MLSDEPLLAIKQLHAYYGQAHILQGIDLELREGCLGIVGRNGMGKSTLCKAIMGLLPRTSGSVRLAGTELRGKSSYRIAGAGIGYVPQGRRVFPSLSTDEHLRMIKVSRGAAWDRGRVYDLFPRLGQRRGVSGAKLSGGEQQMLAIGRALLTNPRLLIMDEPSEGLAPAIVDELVRTCQVIVGEGMAVVVVEQNLKVAVSLADRLAVIVLGRVAAEMSGAQLLADPEAQQRYLGVTPVGATP